MKSFILIPVFLAAVSAIPEEKEKKEIPRYVPKPKSQTEPQPIPQYLPNQGLPLLPTPYHINLDLSNLFGGLNVIGSGANKQQLSTKQNQGNQNLIPIPQLISGVIASGGQIPGLTNKKDQNNKLLPQLISGVLPTLFRPTGPLNAAQTEQQQQKIVNKPHQQQQPQQPKFPTPKGPVKTIDVCYVLGDDINYSYVPYVPSEEGKNHFVAYLEFLTTRTNILLNTLDPSVPEHNNEPFLYLKPHSHGPFDRTEFYVKNPDDLDPKILEQDARNIGSRYGCDMVIFLNYNRFDPDTEKEVESRNFSGFAKGEACQPGSDVGHAKVFDHFLNGDHVGSQVLAHHILLLLTSSLNQFENRNCEYKHSLLHDQILYNQQFRDKCAISKLSRSYILSRPCFDQ